MAKMEPVTVSILSLPEPLRHVMHIGIHVTVLQTGGLRAIYELVASEFCYLWNTGMHISDFPVWRVCGNVFLGIQAASGERFQVAIGATNFDGPGFEDIYRCHGKNSIEGCVKWEDMMGVFLTRKGAIYPGYRRFLPLDAPERQLPDGDPIMRDGTPLHFVETELRPPPTRKTYAAMMADARSVEAHGPARSVKLHVRGVKGVHPFAALPYFQFTYMGYDLMHIIIGNIVKMLLHLLRRHTAQNANRGVSAKVLNYEHARGRFLDEVVESGPSWAFSIEEERLVDRRLHEVCASDKAAVPRNVFRLLGMQNTHSLMTFAFTYAHHCMSDLGSRPHTTAVQHVRSIAVLGSRLV
jgi:hypothetical protein